jgi:hypothetical protein
MENFVQETILFRGCVYRTVQSPTTGRIWLDRNLGAVATGDYGEYFMFGEALCPDGYEVPSGEAWDNELTEGKDLNWLDIPLAGFLSTRNKLHNNGNMAHLWSSSEKDGKGVTCRRSIYSCGAKGFMLSDNKEFRFSVRLIKQ